MLSIWRWTALAASLALAATLAWALLRDAGRRPDRALAQAVVASHVRSLMATHLYDVESTDQHTVKPWFDGKIDFAPDVRDFKSENFPLQGGRLDYLINRPVAALVYRHDKHYINLFIWPAPNDSDQPEELTTQQGYQLIHWTSANMTYWAISDTTPDLLHRFTTLVRAHDAPTTHPN